MHCVPIFIPMLIFTSSLLFVFFLFRFELESNVRKSRHDTISGKPNVLYYVPETHNGESGLIKEIYQKMNLTMSEIILFKQRCKMITKNISSMSLRTVTFPNQAIGVKQCSCFIPFLIMQKMDLKTEIFTNYNSICNQ